MLIRNDPNPPRFENRRCSGCSLELEPTSTSRWRLNDLIPLGSTARYECPVCGNIFQIRTKWHLATLLTCLALLLYISPRLLNESVLTQTVALLTFLYVIYALVTEYLDRVRNPLY